MRVALMTMLAIALALTVSAAFAAEGTERGPQVGPGAGGGSRMGALDANNDGVISKNEWVGNADVFTRYDTNGDGKLDSVEMAAMRQQAEERRRERGEAAPGQQGPGGPGGQEARGTEGRGMRGGFGAGFGVFETLDEDNDGQLSKKELDDFTAKVMAADTDKNGLVSREEAQVMLRARAMANAGRMFMQRFDANKDGKVTREELGGEAERFDRFDSDKDGAITTADFANMPPDAFGGMGRGDRRGGEDRGQGRGQGAPGRDRRGGNAGQEAPAAL